MQSPEGNGKNVALDIVVLGSKERGEMVRQMDKEDNFRSCMFLYGD